jgi:hypothetical protein
MEGELGRGRGYLLHAYIELREGHKGRQVSLELDSPYDVSMCSCDRNGMSCVTSIVRVVYQTTLTFSTHWKVVYLVIRHCLRNCLAWDTLQ